MSNNNENDSVDGRTTERIPRRRVVLFASFLAKHERIFNVLSTSVTAIFTVVLATSTVFLWKETRDLRDFAQLQSADMKDSIVEAARAATAMQNVATAVAVNAQAANESVALFRDANVRQMRAYLTIGFLGLVPQDPATNYRFEVRISLQNVGNTPANDVENNTYARVLPFPLPKDFVFPEFNETIAGRGVLMPRDSKIITSIADRIYSDDDVHEISYGSGKRLYVYGIIKYKDVFGVARKTTFCQEIEYLKNNTFMARNTPDYNEAD
jgi:hypothetical protein